jgi:hypothetical protein
LGPRPYFPRVEERSIRRVNFELVEQNSALRIKAERGFKDKKGIQRIAG